MPDLVIPAAFNTLDDVAFDDGHPCSAWLGREVIHNDRRLHAITTKNLLCEAWDVSNPWVSDRNAWHRLAHIRCHTSPGPPQRYITVRYRGGVTPSGTTTFGCWFAVQTRARLLPAPFSRVTAADVFLKTSTVIGGVENWVDSTIYPIRANTEEEIEVFVLPLARDDAAGADVTGTLTGLGGSMTSIFHDNVAPNFNASGIGPGWVIRATDPASFPAEGITDWHDVVQLLTPAGGAFGDWLEYYPPLQDWEQSALRGPSGTLANWQARQVSTLTLYSLSIDEVVVTAL